MEESASVQKLPSIGDLFSTSWAFYKSSWKLLTWLILLPILATIAVVVIVGIIVATILAVSNGQITTDRLPLLIPPVLIAVIALVIINSLGQIALVKAISLGGQAKTRELIKSSWPLVGRFILLGLLLGLIVLVGFILLIIPGLMFSVWFMFASLILVVENIGGMSALKRSRIYVKGKFWGIVGRVGLLTLIILAISWIASLSENQAITIIFQLFTTFFIAPLATIYTFKLYQGAKGSAGASTSTFPASESVLS